MNHEIFSFKNLDSYVYKAFGTAYVDAFLLSQYRKSEKFKSYLYSFSKEFDLLFEQVNRVMRGRYLEYAKGAQLDVIGDIVGLSRNVPLPNTYFGFQGASGIDGMSDEDTPLGGGLFLSEHSKGYVITPLDDLLYAKAIRAKAFLNLNRTEDVNSTYRAIKLLLGRSPSVLMLNTVGPKQVELRISRADIEQREVHMLSYMSKFFLPTATVFNIVQVQ